MEGTQKRLTCRLQLVYFWRLPTTPGHLEARAPKRDQWQQRRVPCHFPFRINLRAVRLSSPHLSWLVSATRSHRWTNCHKLFFHHPDKSFLMKISSSTRVPSWKNLLVFHFHKKIQFTSPTGGTCSTIVAAYFQIDEWENWIPWNEPIWLMSKRGPSRRTVTGFSDLTCLQRHYPTKLKHISLL